MLLVKKYPNRRLYDTRSSRYITLNDLERTIRSGEDITIQDAQDGRDLTQETLAQLIFERNGGRMLPATLLMRLIRLDDAALGEFFTRYVSWALDVYIQAKDRARALLPLNPLATAPFAATDALARMILGAAQWGSAGGNSSRHQQQPPIPPFSIEPLPDGADASAVPPMPGEAPPSSDIVDEMQRLRREIDALKQSMRGPPSKRAKSNKTSIKRPGRRP